MGESQTVLDKHAGRNITIATYNIQAANKPRAILRNIHTMVQNGVVIFCIQEVRQAKKKKFIGNKLLEMLGKEWQIEYFFQTNGKTKELGLCIIWNTSVVKAYAVERLLLPPLSRRTFIEFCWEKLLLMKRRSFFRRKVLIIDFYLGRKKVRVTNIHLDWQGGPLHRKNQLQFAYARLNAMPPVDYEVICGDFNTVKWPNVSNEEKHLSAVFGERFTDVSSGIAWTADLNALSFYGVLNTIINTVVKALHIHLFHKIDYIWSRKLTCISCDILKAGGSDHFPLIARFVY